MIFGNETETFNWASASKQILFLEELILVQTLVTDEEPVDSFT